MIQNNIVNEITTHQAKTNEGETVSEVNKKIKSHFLEKRYIFLNSSVTDKSSFEIVEKLLYLNSLNTKEAIYFFINSPGGSVTSGMSIIDTMAMIQNPIYTISTGLAASMGALIFSQGSKGFRYVFSHTRIMIHQPLIGGQIVAPASDIRIHANQINKTKHEINLLLSKSTGKTLKKIEEDTDRDYYLNAKESIKYGIADKEILNITDLTPQKKVKNKETT